MRPQPGIWVAFLGAACLASLCSVPRAARAQRRVTGLSVSVSPTGVGGMVDVTVDLNTTGGSETVRRLGPNFAQGIQDFDTMTERTFYTMGSTGRARYTRVGTGIDYQYTLLNPVVPGVEFGDGSEVLLPEVTRDSPGLLRGVFSHTYASNQVVRVRVGAVTLLDDETPATPLFDGQPIVLEPRTMGTNAYYTARGIFQGSATIITAYSLRPSPLAPFVQTDGSTYFITDGTPVTSTEKYTIFGSSAAIAVTDVTTIEVCVTSGACPNPCRNGASCTAGTLGCVGGMPTNCDDSVACTIDFCDPTVPGGCVRLNDDTVCDTTDLCVESAVCDPIDIDADPLTGCVETPVDCTPLLDTIACTLDTCDPAVGCNPPDDSLCDDSNPCTVDTCSTFADCLNDGTGVNIPCVTDTGGDMCLAGRCMGDQAGTCTLVPADCDDNNPCTEDSCNSALGCINDGTGVGAACDDGNACTFSDSCDGDVAGTCSGILQICDDNNPCTDDACDPVSGCVYMDNGTCPNGNNPNSNNSSTGRVGSGCHQSPGPWWLGLLALSVLMRRRPATRRGA